MFYKKYDTYKLYFLHCVRISSKSVRNLLLGGWPCLWNHSSYFAEFELASKNLYFLDCVRISVEIYSSYVPRHQKKRNWSYLRNHLCDLSFELRSKNYIYCTVYKFHQNRFYSDYIMRKILAYVERHYTQRFRIKMFHD